MTEWEIKKVRKEMHLHLFKLFKRRGRNEKTGRCGQRRRCRKSGNQRKRGGRAIGGKYIQKYKEECRVVRSERKGGIERKGKREVVGRE